MIAISAKGEGAKAQVDSRFGRCEYIIFYDPENDEFAACENSSRLAGGGAGVNAAQFLSENNVKALLTGNVGPKALRTLKAAGIKVYTGASGTVENTLEAYREGNMTLADDATVDSHFGQGRGRRRR